MQPRYVLSIDTDARVDIRAPSQRASKYHNTFYDQFRPRPLVRTAGAGARLEPTCTLDAPAMSTDPARVAGRQDHRRQNHRTELAQDITAAGGKTDAFLKELDTHQLYLDDLVDRFIAEKETEYIEFANSLRERYKYFIKRPLADIAKSKQHVSSEAVIEEHPGKSQGPDIEARPVDGSASGPTLTDESGVSNLDERMVPQIGPPPTPRSPAALDMAKSTESEPTSPIIEQKAALNQRRLSAIRNSTASTRTPRKKRVSLVVGDEVVAPSDVISRLSLIHI